MIMQAPGLAGRPVECRRKMDAESTRVFPRLRHDATSTPQAHLPFTALLGYINIPTVLVTTNVSTCRIIVPLLGARVQAVWSRQHFL